MSNTMSKTETTLRLVTTFLSFLKLNFQHNNCNTNMQTLDSMIKDMEDVLVELEAKNNG